MVASQLAGNMCLSNISSSTVPQPGFKAAQYNRLKRIQSYLMPLPQLQGVPFGSARDTLYYSSCLASSKTSIITSAQEDIQQSPQIFMRRSPTIQDLLKKMMSIQKCSISHTSKVQECTQSFRRSFHRITE